MRPVSPMDRSRPRVVRPMLREGVPGMTEAEWRPGVTVYIDASALESIDDRRGNQTRSEWIRRAIAEALAKEAGR